MRSNFGKSVALIIIGTGLGQIISIGISPILTRLYSPEVFGALSIFMAISGILGAVASLRYDFSIPIIHDEEDAISVIWACLFILIAVVFFLFLIAIFIDVLGFFGPETEIDKNIVFLIPCCVAAIAIFNIAISWLTRRKDFRKLAAIKVLQPAFVGGLQILLGFSVGGAMGVIAPEIAGRILAVFFIMSPLLIASGAWLRGVDLRRMKQNIGRYKKFPLLSAPSTFFNVLSLRLPILLMAPLYGLDAAGWLMLSQRVLGGPVTLVGQSVSRVYVGEVSESLRKSKPNVKRLMIKTSGLLFVAALPVVLALSLFGPAVFSFFFGGDWRESGHFVASLAWMFLFQISVVPISQTITLLERQELQLLLDVARSVLILSAFVVSKLLDFNMFEAIFLYSAISGITYIVIWGLNFMVAREVSYDED